MTEAQNESEMVISGKTIQALFAKNKGKRAKQGATPPLSMAYSAGASYDDVTISAAASNSLVSERAVATGLVLLMVLILGM